MIHVPVVHRLRLAHLGQIYRDLDLDFTGLFKDQRDVNGFILNKWRMKPHEHDVIAATFQKQLAACGDWCLGGRIEDAFLSGQRLGLSLAASFGK